MHVFWMEQLLLPPLPEQSLKSRLRGLPLLVLAHCHPLYDHHCGKTDSASAARLPFHFEWSVPGCGAHTLNRSTWEAELHKESFWAVWLRHWNSGRGLILGMALPARLEPWPGLEGKAAIIFRVSQNSVRLFQVDHAVCSLSTRCYLLFRAPQGGVWAAMYLLCRT